MKTKLSLMILIALTICAAAQSPSEPKRAELKVTVSDVKPGYSAGEFVTFKATLTNTGRSWAYVPKHFGEHGGGIPGFSHKVVFLSGKQPEIGCGGNGDAWGDRRTAAQILKEDYLVLGPGEFVGRQFEIQPCEFGTTGRNRAWGRFQIEISYWPSLLSTKEVAEMPDLKYSVAVDEVKTKPFEVTITEPVGESLKSSN